MNSHIRSFALVLASILTTGAVTHVLAQSVPLEVIPADQRVIAPDFMISDVQGKPFRLSTLKGRVVLVDFWASWCGPCRAENPNVVKAFNRYKGQKFTIIGVSLDRPTGKDKWLALVNSA